MSQNERKTTKIRASKVGNFSPFSCPGDGDDVPLAFEVHQPSAQFSKRNLGPPAFVVFVALYGGALPPVHRVAGLIAAAAPTAVKAAVVAGDGTVLLFDLKAGVPAVN